jgi:hypothetical protein
MDVGLRRRLVLRRRVAEGPPNSLLDPAGDGVTSEIAEIRPNEFISIRHLGYIAHNGVEDNLTVGTSAEAVQCKLDSL